MSQVTFKIQQPVMQRVKYYPDYLSKDMENFKASNAVYPMVKDDDNAIDFFKKAKDRKLNVINEIKTIYRTKRGNKEFTNYTLNFRLVDDNGIETGDEFLHVFGCEKFPKIKEVIKNNEIKLEPDGIRLQHVIPFNAKEVEKIIKMCHDDYKENILFVYNEIPNDSGVPVNQHRTDLIRSEKIFKEATNREIKKIIEKKANEIESLDDLNTFKLKP